MTDFSDMLPYIGPVGVLFGIFSGVWYRVEGKITAGVADAKAAGLAAAKKAEEADKALNEFKLKVAEEYASWDTVRSIEARLTERIDGLSEQVMKMPDTIVARIVDMIKLSK
ncbi:hypothetical protein [Bradyrhizobium sp. DASA03007]|uniref:hypothetical protein n=1 Tax=unclassified Bradyrhizobium TaxID=2631580 RepID=UPI003F70768F